jgi:hypothetical protein
MEADSEYEALAKLHGVKEAIEDMVYYETGAVVDWSYSHQHISEAAASAVRLERYRKRQAESEDEDDDSAA